MSLRDICRKSVICVSADTNILEAAKRMRDHHIGDLVVVDEDDPMRKPLGMVTDRDLVTMVLACNVPPTELTVADVMKKDPVVAQEDDGILAVTRKMRTAGVRRIPVVDEQGSLAGICAMDDLYQILSSELLNLAQVPRRQISREQREDYYSSRF